MKKDKAFTKCFLEEALDGAKWHEAQREKCAKLGSIATSRAFKHSKMDNGIRYAVARARRFDIEEPKYQAKILQLQEELEALQIELGIYQAEDEDEE